MTAEALSPYRASALARPERRRVLLDYRGVRPRMRPDAFVWTVGAAAVPLCLIAAFVSPWLSVFLFGVATLTALLVASARRVAGVYDGGTPTVSGVHVGLAPTRVGCTPRAHQIAGIQTPPRRGA